MKTETLTWHKPSEKMPDDDTTVLMHMPTADSEPVWPGYFDGEQWMLPDGFEPACAVEAWAHLPGGPQ